MLIDTPAGFEGWMREVGFTHVHIAHLQGTYSMAVGRK
jgi:hypothetical protein